MSTILTKNWLLNPRHFLRGVCALCVFCGSIVADQPKADTPHAAATEAATWFFRNHPNAIDFERTGDRLWFANRHVGIEFRESAGGFQVARFYSIKHGQDFLPADFEGQTQNLFRILMKGDPAVERETKASPFFVGPFQAREVSAECTGDIAQRTLRLAWRGLDLSKEQGAMDVEVQVTLKADDPLSYWRFAIKNRSTRYGIDRVYFPVLNLAPIGDAKENVYIFPMDRGRLVEDPFHQPPGYGDGVDRSGRHPGAFAMQFQALYNKKSNIGLYLGTFDPTPNLKNTEAPNYPTHIAWKPGHFPPNIGFAGQDYALPYDCVVGPFAGDWWDACQIYRQWALKQSWCSKGPLVIRKDIPQWYKETPLFLVCMSHSRDEEVAMIRDDFLKYLQLAGVPLPCNWYGWKAHQTELTAYDLPPSTVRTTKKGGRACENVHDGNYPKLPALPSFAAACKQLREAGGRVLPYVCLQIYDQGPTENAPYVTEARPHVVRDAQGNMQTYGREPSWAMCVWPPWWRERLKETCLALMERENAGGFYLDTMSGAGEACFWTAHGHSACGGSSLPLGMHGMAKHIRDAVKAANPDTITTGEDSAENMIDVVDGKFYSKTLTPNSRAPLFAAVYKDYIPRYGMTLRPDDGDSFYMHATSLFVEGAQMGRLNIGTMRGVLSFDNPQHKDMLAFLGRLVACYKQPVMKKFLCYGQLMRPVRFLSPQPMPVVSAKANWGRYVGQPVELPALLSGVFRSQDGDLGVFIVNASDNPAAFRFELTPERYPLSPSKSYRVSVLNESGEAVRRETPSKGKVEFNSEIGARDVVFEQIQAQ